eukprot:gene21915-27992_t
MYEHEGGWEENTQKWLHKTVNEVELKDAVILVFFNKQDLPNACKPELMRTHLKIDEIAANGKIIHCQPCSAVTGEGLYEGFEWLQNTLLHIRDTAPPPPVLPTSTNPPKIMTADEQEKSRLDNLLIEWLERVDEEDEVFLSKVKACSLDSWDHRTHLRIAWLILSKHDRKEGLPMIFDLIKHFIANSPRTQRSRGTTFHETMTYFWVHMVHYAMTATKLPRQDFKTFLLMNPQLSNGGLFLHYYSKQRMLHDADARIMVLLPDKLPLPSLVTSTASTTSSVVSVSEGVKYSAGVLKLVPSAPLTDGEFLSLFHAQRLPGWGHDAKIRVIYLLLCRYGRSSASVDYILSRLASVEKANAHLTLNYFWIQMVTYHIHFEMKACKGQTGPGVVVFDGFNNADYIKPSLPQEVNEGEEGSVKGVETELTSLTVSGDGIGSSNVDVVGPSEVNTSKNTPFAVFYQLPHSQPLKNQLLYEKYYSRSALDAKEAETSFVMPNLKQLPQVVV